MRAQNWGRRLRKIFKTPLCLKGFSVTYGEFLSYMFHVERLEDARRDHDRRWPMRFRTGWDPDQPLLLPPRPDEWLSPGHLARVVSEAVDAWDLSTAEAAFHSRGPGASAYPPKLLLKLLLYGYLPQRFSSRRISEACREDLAFLWLSRLTQPKHSTIAAFRQQHSADLPGWMAQVVCLCMDLGMVGFRLGAVDGTKIHSDASKHKAMSYQRMKEVIPQLKKELAHWVAAHETDAVPPAPELPADHVERVQERLARIQQAKADLEARWVLDHPDDPEPEAKAQINFTDPESAIMVTKNQGVQQAYNAQIVVDAQEGVIVGTALSAHPHDVREFEPALEAVEATTGRPFAQVTADAGYFSADNVTAANAQQVDAYIAAGSDQWRTVKGHKLFGKGQFVYDAETNTYQCPAHQELPYRGDRTESIGGGQKRHVAVYRGERATCGACPLKDQCTASKNKAKQLTRGADDAIRDAMKAKVRTPEGDAVYRQRQGIVEPAIGILKETRGFRQFSMRGMEKVTGEWTLLILAFNIRKIARKLTRLAEETGKYWTLMHLRANKPIP